MQNAVIAYRENKYQDIKAGSYGRRKDFGPVLCTESAGHQ